MPNPKKVQLKDIAKEAKVSTALVSYVLNGRHSNRIKKETADRVKAVARRLNYRPNHFAKGLKTQRSNTVGLILADLANPFSTQIARIIENELGHFNYNVLIGSTDENGDKLKELVEIFKSRQVDGLIILPTEDAKEEIAQLHQSNFPYVLMDRYFPDTPFNFVVNDNRFATFSTTSQLIKNNRKKIGFITLKTDLFHIAERKRGFLEACSQAGIAAANMIIEAKWATLDKDIAKGIDKLRAKHTDLDALLFSTDMLTMYGLKYAIEHKLNLKDDFEIMAVDWANFYGIYPKPIQYYKQPLEAMGKEAVRFLMSKIEDKSSNVIQEIIKGELVIGNAGIIN